MVTVPKRDERDVIARAPFLDEMLGVMVARHGDEGPIIDVHIEPADSGQSVDFGLTPLEAHVLADELHEIATATQRAGWTLELIADVREHYLPGATDDEIVARLDGLVERLGSAPVLRPGVLRRDAGLMLIADAHRGVVRRVADALFAITDQLAALRAAVRELDRIYWTESGTER